MKKKTKNAMMSGMYSHTKNIRSGLLFLLLCACVWTVGPDTAAAADLVLPSGMESTIASGVSKIISLLNIVTWILFIFLNFVLDPQFIFDLDNGSFMAMLNTIWQLSRDLMNVAFALMLVAAAVYTIVTANKEFVTQHAKNFLLAVVLVNFSWFVPRIIIDVSNVAAASIYGIPSLLLDNSSSIKSCQYKSSIEEGPQCTDSGEEIGGEPVYTCGCRIVVNVDMFMKKAKLANYETQAMKDDGWDCQGGIICIQSKPWDANLVSGHSAILNGLVINHAHLQTMALVPPPVDADDIGQMTTFLLVEGIILLIHVAMFFPLLAMFVAFLIRIPILWLTMAFMPFVFLSWVIPNNEYTGMTKRIWEEFLKAAFLPAAIAVPLSVGFILVNAGDQLSGGPIGSIHIRLIDGISNYWELLWWLMTLGVLWVGTFTVFEKAGGLYAKTASVIQHYGQAWGKLALKAPLAAPIIPGIGMTPLAALKFANPHTLDSEISGTDGIRGALSRFRGGTFGTHAAATAAGTKAGGAGGLTDIQMLQLHTDLLALQTAIRAPGATEADKHAAVAAFEAKPTASLVNLKLDKDDVKGSLKAFVSGLRGSGKTGTTVDNIGSVADNI